MCGKFIHRRRDIVQISFPNNRRSTRFPRRKVVTKRVWKEEESSAYFGVPNSAVFTPFDIPNPTDNAPTLVNHHAIHYSDAGGYAPAQPLRAGEWGDGHDPAEERKGGGFVLRRQEQKQPNCNAIRWVQHGGVYVSPAQPFECNENGHRRHPQGGVGDAVSSETVQVASQRSLQAPVITLFGGLSPTSNDTDGDGLYDGPCIPWDYAADGKYHLGENYTVNISASESYLGKPYSIWNDTNNNGIIDAGEPWNACHPLNPDTDGDSANDGQEAVSGYKLIKMETRGQEIFDSEVPISASAGKALDPFNFELKNGKYQWRDVDDDGISDYNETHYDIAYPNIVAWANAKSLETGGEFNATEYLTNQFNPFVAENIPPMITYVNIDTWDDWGWSWGLPVVEASWSKIDVWAMDVADFTIIMGVKDRNSYLAFSGLGGGIERYFTATIGIDYWADSLAEYYVNVTVTDKVGNVAYFEKEVAGFFGGIMNFLEDVWNGIAGAFEAAWEAVKSAVNWLMEMIEATINGMISSVINPLISTIQNWLLRFGNTVNNLLNLHTTPQEIQMALSAVIMILLELTLIVTVIQVIIAVVEGALTFGMAFGISALAVILVQLAITVIFTLVGSEISGTLLGVLEKFILPGLGSAGLAISFISLIVAFISFISPGAYTEAVELVTISTGQGPWSYEKGMKTKEYSELPGSAYAIVLALLSFAVSMFSVWIGSQELESPIHPLLVISFDIFAMMLGTLAIKESFGGPSVLGGVSKGLALCAMGTSITAFSLHIATYLNP